MSRATTSSLARERNARGLTQEELANLLGVARSTLSNVENGYVQPWPRLRVRAAQLLGVPVDALFDMPKGSNRA